MRTLPPADSFWEMIVQKRPLRRFLGQGREIQMFGRLLPLTGTLDLVWIASYPHYALKVFGTTFSGWAGEFVIYQHPFIHWVLGYGFKKTPMGILGLPNQS